MCTRRPGVRAATGVPEGEEVFMMHPKFGAVTCCPSNLGTGMRGSVHMKVPKLIAKIGVEGIDKLARERHCQARGSSGEHSEVVDRIGISNWRRIGLPEYELVQDMIKCVNFFAEEEDKLAFEEEANAERLAKTVGKHVNMATRNSRLTSSQIARRLNLKRAEYPPDIVKLVMGLRAASYKMGGTDLPYLFGKIDVDKSGSLDANEFKKVLHRFVSHACL